VPAGSPARDNCAICGPAAAFSVHKKPGHSNSGGDELSAACIGADIGPMAISSFAVWVKGH